MFCPNCNNNDLELFHNKVWSMDQGAVYKCNNCELLFIHPMMSKVEESEFYINYNQHVKDRGMTLENSVSEFHIKSQVIAQERFNLIRNYFDHQKVLEIGSSTGAFLSLLNTCNTNACELTEINREFSKQFINGKAYESIEAIDEKDFDIICMFHVFEHIQEPIEFLQSCKKLLKKGAYIIVEVPHSDDPLITLYNCQEFKDFVFQPMHPMIYNTKSLDYVFRQAELKKENVIFHQRYGLDNHLSWFKNKKAGGDNELSSLFSNNVDYKNKLKEIKKTDTIFYIARNT